MHTSQNMHAATGTVGGLGARLPVMPGQLELGHLTKRDLEKLLRAFRHWMDSEWSGGATVIPIEAVRAYFGWPRR